MRKKELVIKDESGVYVSVVSFYKTGESLNPYDGDIICDKTLLMLTHYAESSEEATKMAKVAFAKDIFSNEENVLFMCDSVKITAADIQNILDNNKPN